MATTDATPTPDQAAAQALAEGRLRDPFSLLGLHTREGVQTVTAYAPGADSVSALISKNAPIALQPVPGFGGLWTGAVPPETCAYRLAATRGGDAWEWDDPYRFSPVLGELDEHLLGEGAHRRLWRVLGAHMCVHEGVEGVHFGVWAPNAERVSVVGPFNMWDGLRAPMRPRGSTGVWEIFIPGLSEGELYKYEICGAGGVVLPLKADPVGFGAQLRPETASVVRDLRGARWSDNDWMANRGAAAHVDQPISVYEVHLGSWRRVYEDGGRPLSYCELADQLVRYAADMGFTHIELTPISEHPFDGSWGYQPVGLYAPTSRHGSPDELRAFVNAAHQAGLGVILDWVPGHFPSDAHGLAQFDGTPLYEHADPREGFHQDWNTLIYNYGRNEVANYLASNALYWLEEYHLDGLRVDAVASMLYRDYSRKDGEWVPNKDGGRENYEAIDLMRTVNTLVYGELPGVMTVAEESTAFPGVSRPAHHGGLGFGFKWNMGWMNDTLDYMQTDPIYRRYHHGSLTFSLVYAFSENYILPISHDEVVHGKGSMLTKMPGEGETPFAHLRAFYGYMWTHPGKKLLFMGCEFAQRAEWNHDAQLDWGALDSPLHKGAQTLVRDLNRVYRETPALYVNDARPEGFEWLEAGDADNSVLAYVRHGRDGDAPVVVVCNLTPVERVGYRVGFPTPGRWREILNTDADVYAGQNRGNMGGVVTEDVPWNNQARSAEVYMPPLSVVLFQAE